MQKETTKKERIGKVMLTHIRTGRVNISVYGDGKTEDISYNRPASNRNYAPTCEEKNYSFWAEKHHNTSPVRHNLLKWFPFDPNGSVLEVGAGCGDLTGLLCSKAKKVVALEYSSKRALIIANRHCECSNLEVIVGNLQDYESEERFDYVTAIGELEHAQTFYRSKSPHESFLSKVSSLLKPNGTLILAIENKIGLKYITGAPEDHTGRIFDSIYNYPHPSIVRTFSKKELTDLLNTAGLYSHQWYYPFPDYKLPQEVLSEQITPGELDSIWSLLSATNEGRYKKFLSAKMLGKTLARAGLFGEFANSFLVIARKEGAAKNFRCLRFIGANMRRKNRFRTNKQICTKGQEKLFIRSADNDDAREFIHEIFHRDMLAKKYFGDRAEVACGELSGDSLIYPYIEFPMLVELIAKHIDDGDTEFGKSYVDEYRRFLLGLPIKRCVPGEFMKEFGIASREVSNPLQCLCCGVLDCIPHNIMVDEEHKKWHIVDNEWTFDFPVPVDFVIFRAISSLVMDLQTHIQSQVSQERPVIRFSGYGSHTHYMPLSWLDVLTNLETPLKQLASWSSAFQNAVLICHTRHPLKLKVESGAIKRATIRKIPKARMEQLYRILRKARQLLRAV